jgi:hypothetical protein
MTPSAIASLAHDKIDPTTPDEAERRAVIANSRGALAEGPSLTTALELERHLEREREDRKEDDAPIAASSRATAR